MDDEVDRIQYEALENTNQDWGIYTKEKMNRR
jgi:hypothetical protein